MNIKSIKKLHETIEQKSQKHHKIPDYLRPLNESEREQNNVERALIVEDNQFKLDSGYVLGDIKIPINNCFGLYWHKKNTNTVEGFIESVTNFLNGANVKLSSSDIARLKIAYGS